MKRLIGVAIPTTMAVLALGGGTARAQYILEGSDTLTDVIKGAITASGANLTYVNTGSGQGEKNMLGANGTHPRQGIAPMSRNFTQTVLDAHGDWYPTPINVVALDAPVISVRNLLGNQCLDVSPGYVAGDQSTAPLNSNLSIILAGYPKGGLTTKSGATAEECSDPRRIQAIKALATCQGVDSIQHIYRRDDASGTQDTWRDHLQFDKWCNGVSPGGGSAAGSNMFNEDLDPIRRPCIGADATKAKTKCTYYPTAQQCDAGAADITDPTYGTLKCTQGLIVALSEKDPGSDDITISVGKRVGLDLTNRTIGLAGLASVNLPDNSSIGTTVNTNTYEPDNIRKGQYMFARRLFLQKSPQGSGDTARDTEENKLFTYVTSNCGIRNIVTNAGFLLPQDGVCGNQNCTDLYNISCTVAPVGVGMPKQLIGYGETCNGTNPCQGSGATCASPNTCAAAPKLAAGYGCNANAQCTNGTCKADSTCN